MFGLPGGLQVYLLLNIPIVLLILKGQSALALGERAAYPVAWSVVAAGLFAAGFHAFHIASGDSRFSLPISYALLAATLLLSTAQAVLLVHHTRQSQENV